MIKKFKSQNATIETPAPRLTLFSRRWLLSTLLVLVGMAVLARLGFWQLDRLEQRRARNAQLAAQVTMPPLDLQSVAALPANPAELKNRPATATGHFDFENQLALKSQTWQGSPGIHLVAPLLLPGGEAVLVDRGWLPFDQSDPPQWQHVDQPGQVTVAGYIRLSDTLPNSQPVTGPQREWYRVDIEAIRQQLPYTVLPIYIQQTPEPATASDLPYRIEPEIDLSDGPHLGYAIQWFLFSLILGAGYIYFFRKETAKHHRGGLQ